MQTSSTDGARRRIQTRKEGGLIVSDDGTDERFCKCKHAESIPGNTHIKCNKPDHDMTGNKHGIKKGWFIYPLLFDPTWKTKVCSNFESNEKSDVSHATSDAVNPQ